MSKALFRRRELLRRLGAASFLAVPVFRESVAEAQPPAAGRARRFVVFYLPGACGWNPGDKDPGGVFNFDNVLAPFGTDLRSDTLILQGLRNMHIEPADENSVHGFGTNMTLTGQDPWVPGTTGKPDRRPILPTVSSLDQLIAKTVGRNSRFTTLEVGAGPPNAGGGGDTISYRDGFLQKPMRSPAQVFSRLFGGVAPTATQSPRPADPTGRLDPRLSAAAQRSILDLVSREIEAIKGMVGASERNKLDAHLTSLRDLEKTIADPPPIAGDERTSVPTSACKPSLGAASDALGVAAPLQAELIYQALACDLTRVATCVYLHSGDGNTTFPFIGVNRGHHGMQHDSMKLGGAVQKDFNKVQSWFMSHIAALARRLKATPEGSGNMLDNTIIWWFSDMTHGWHGGGPWMPTFVCGKAGGLFRTGRIHDCGGAYHHRLLTTFARAMGLTIDSYGDPRYAGPPLSLA